MRLQNYQMCTNCVMDTTDINITFDEDGICDHCNNYYKNILPNWHTDDRGKRALESQVNQIKKFGKGKPFDCILGMSGGIDSSYLACVAKEYGLRPLIFHVDAGWNSQVAVNNIEKIVDSLGFDLYTEVINWAEMQDLQLSFFKAGVPHIDVPQDHAFFATMYHYAAKHRIKYILTGSNYSTECVKNPLEWIYFGTDVRQIKDIHKKFGSRSIKNFPLSDILRHKVYLSYFRGIKVIKPLDYVPYIKTEAEKYLVENFGWQTYPQKHFESRFTAFYEGYWLPKKFGYDTRKVQFSSLILTEQMTREDALKKLSFPAYDPNLIDQDFEYIATKLGISCDELRQYLAAPNKTFRDYKSKHYLFNLGAKILKKVGSERVTKR